MELSNVNNQYISADGKFLWKFTQNLMSGDINCINGSNEKKVMAVFYKLIKAFSEDEIPVGYLVTGKQYGKQNLYLRYDHVSQSIPISSLEEIDYETQRAVAHHLKPIIFIKDFFKITIGSNYWQKSKDIEFKEATKKLIEIAKNNKVPIYITMFFKSGKDIKQYYLIYDIKGSGFVRKKIEKSYFI